MLDIFRNDAFSVTSLTDAFIKAPYKPMRIGQLGLFGSRGIRTTTAVVEWKDGQLALIQTSPRGGADEAPKGNVKRTIETFLVPHLERNATVLADEVQNVRMFGSEDATMGVQELVNERLADLRADHEVTLEHMRASAIQGIVLDADGSTLVNLFTKFGVSQTTGTVSPNASSDEGDALRAEIVVIERAIEAVLGAAPISGYRAFCGATFFDTLRSDLGVTQTLRYADPASLLAQAANARSFTFGGVVWEEYRGSTGGTPFFADDEAYVFPEGVDIFRTYYAPADFNETVNTLGLPGYAKIVPDNELNRYTKIHTQSNPLTICLRPDAVVKVTITT
jgi:hypothetical protein